jgi:hypothetical protein
MTVQTQPHTGRIMPNYGELSRPVGMQSVFSRLSGQQPPAASAAAGNRAAASSGGNAFTGAWAAPPRSLPARSTAPGNAIAPGNAFAPRGGGVAAPVQHGNAFSSGFSSGMPSGKPHGRMQCVPGGAFSGFDTDSQRSPAASTFHPGSMGPASNSFGHFQPSAIDQPTSGGAGGNVFSRMSSAARQQPPPAGNVFGRLGGATGQAVLNARPHNSAFQGGCVQAWCLLLSMSSSPNICQRGDTSATVPA